MAMIEILNRYSIPAERARDAQLTESALARGGYLAAIIALVASGPGLAVIIGAAAVYMGVRSDQNGRKADRLERGTYNQSRGLRRVLRP